MKIVHVISHCGTGGAEVFVKSLLTALLQVKEPVTIELWVMSKMEDMYPENKAKMAFEKFYVGEMQTIGIPVRFINKRPHKDWWKTRKQIDLLYRSYQPDLVHTHLESVSFHTCAALSKYKVPIVQTIHNTVLNNPVVQDFFTDRYITAYVVISEKVERLVSEKVNKKNQKTHLIHNGVRLEDFNRIRRNPANPVRKIISVGRLTKAKDYDNLIEAVKRLKEKLLTTQSDFPEVLIVGDGELRDHVTSLIRINGLENDIKLLGIRNDIPKLLSEADLYVMSSEWEGLSIALIEALTSGIPIVATDAGSNNEIVEHGRCGTIVPIKDPEALAHGIHQLIMDEKLRIKYSEKAQSTAERFDITICASKHLDLYKETSLNRSR